MMLTGISIMYFVMYLENKLGLSYNDARSHLDIGRRVVEGLKPGLAQIGSVWLPLNHILMIPTIGSDIMWHTGLSGAIQSMGGFVLTGLAIVEILRMLRVGVLGRAVGVLIFVANINILYLQSTAMTELLLLATMTVGSYELIAWHETDSILSLIKSAFWIMLATLTRYDGWFLLAYAAALVCIQTFKRYGYKRTEGVVILFGTLGGFGVVLWLLWNQVIFKDALYFALGPFSAHAQQEQLNAAGVLATKGNLWLSLKVYAYALFYNAYTIPVLLAITGMIRLAVDRTLSTATRISTSVLLSPLLFNIIALYLGFSVLFVQGISGDTWFNVRYGIMLMPTIAIFVGYLVDRMHAMRPLIMGLCIFVLVFAFLNNDAVTIDDARVGSSQKNVSEVSGYLSSHAGQNPGFILISAASHDAIIFSSGLPMRRFIHEGTGKYWESATTMPDQWARWIVMRTYDDNDLSWRSVHNSPGFLRYTKVAAFPFADIYELKPEYLGQLRVDTGRGKLDEAAVRAANEMDLLRWIHTAAQTSNGNILVSRDMYTRVFISSAVTEDRYITDPDPRWKEALVSPKQIVRWIIIPPASVKDTIDPVQTSPEFRDYTRVFRTTIADVYELRE
jgi:hypothetical protein